MSIPSTEPNVLGNTQLDSFDVLIIGSGAGGSPVAHVLTKHGQKVLILEAGNNYYPGLDDPSGLAATPFSNDHLKNEHRNMIHLDPLVDPRSFRVSPEDGARREIGEVNALPKTVGGGALHAQMGFPRFEMTDFQFGTLLGDVPGASFADWPVDYDMLEPFYCEAEAITGTQGVDGADPFAAPRSKPYPNPPGQPMYCSLLVADAATNLGYTPYPYPSGINSRPYRGRPACINCGMCGQACPVHAKGAPAVTFLREALLTDLCQLRYNSPVVKLLVSGNGNEITGVEYMAPDGSRQVATADRYVLAASPIEDVRLLLMSDPGGPGLGNSSGMLGRNLMFHVLNLAIGIFPQRIHGHRGSGESHGISDFRGVPGDPGRPLGGIVDFVTSDNPILEAKNYATIPLLAKRGTELQRLMRESPLRDHLVALEMIAEDAPQMTNTVDLDPELKTMHGLPAARITYKRHDFELSARSHYEPKMIELLKESGAQFAFMAPLNEPPESRHIFGTMRMGTDSKTSVCDADGRFHDIGNLYNTDGGLFPTSSGYNPTLTIHALAYRVGADMAFPGNPERALEDPQ